MIFWPLLRNRRARNQGLKTMNVHNVVKLSWMFCAWKITLKKQNISLNTSVSSVINRSKTRAPFSSTAVFTTARSISVPSVASLSNSLLDWTSTSKLMEQTSHTYVRSAASRLWVCTTWETTWRFTARSAATSVTCAVPPSSRSQRSTLTARNTPTSDHSSASIAASSFETLRRWEQVGGWGGEALFHGKCQTLKHWPHFHRHSWHSPSSSIITASSFNQFFIGNAKLASFSQMLWHNSAEALYVWSYCDIFLLWRVYFLTSTVYHGWKMTHIFI